MDPLWIVTRLPNETEIKLRAKKCIIEKQGALCFYIGVNSSITKAIIAPGQWLMVEKEVEARDNPNEK